MPLHLHSEERKRTQNRQVFASVDNEITDKLWYKSGTKYIKDKSWIQLLYKQNFVYWNNTRDVLRSYNRSRIVGAVQGFVKLR